MQVSRWPPIEIVDVKTGKIVLQLWLQDDQTYLALDDVGMSRDVAIYSYSTYENWRDRIPS